jgi:hypothetical protein
MPAFPKPVFEYDFDLSLEIKRLRDHRRSRQIPDRRKNTLLVATWNIANFGDLEQLGRILGPSYRNVFTDAAGNNERMAFVYHSRKVKLLEKIGEIAIPPSQYRWITLPGVQGVFNGFDRNR